jgi:hypothetical protein
LDIRSDNVFFLLFAKLVDADVFLILEGFLLMCYLDGLRISPFPSRTSR